MKQKPDKVIPALYGGIIMAVISSVPFLSFINCLCCAGIMLGGFLGIFFYKNNFTPDTPPFTAGDCMGVGALSGVFGAVIGTILSALFIALFGNIMGDFIMEFLRNADIQVPPEALDALEESLSAGFTIMSLFISFISSLIINAIFGLLGGLIGYSIYKPKQQMMQPPMVQPHA